MIQLLGFHYFAAQSSLISVRVQVSEQDQPFPPRNPTDVHFLRKRMDYRWSSFVLLYSPSPWVLLIKITLACSANTFASLKYPSTVTIFSLAPPPQHVLVKMMVLRYTQNIHESLASMLLKRRGAGGGQLLIVVTCELMLLGSIQFIVYVIKNNKLNVFSFYLICKLKQCFSFVV